MTELLEVPRSHGAPEPLHSNSLARLAADVRWERRNTAPLPPGDTDFSVRRTIQIVRDPLPLLLDAYERHGPVFTLRGLHLLSIFMLGPEANHYVTVSHADNFRWRDGSFGDLIPLLGDGMLTIDGDYHRRARQIMLPAFHHDRIAAAVDVMRAEAERELDSWRVGEVVDVYHRMRELAMRIAMRALLGLDPDDAGTGRDAAIQFERALSFYGTDAVVRLMRGPGTPWRRMHLARERLDRIVFAEIARRRRDPGEGADILGMLLAASDEDGSRLSDQEVRDQVMTLMFAGHDTTTSTVTFLLYELARHPDALRRIVAEQDEVLAGNPPSAEQLFGGLPQLEMAIDETLRLYPPAWVGPRRAVEGFEFAGCHVPAGAYVNYCSWASHRIPEVFPDPEAFVPERFEPDAFKALPKGAYVPFGGGSRTCIGKRFGQMEIKTIATVLLQRCRCELLPGRVMTVRQMPTLGPRGGLEMAVRERE